MSVNRKTGPSIKVPDKITLPVIEEYTLQNNIPLFTINSDEHEIIKMDFIFKAGLWYQKQPLVSSFTSMMLKEGTKNLSSFEIAEKLDFYGASIACVSEKDNANVSLYTIKKHFSEIIKILDEILYKPTFPENELQIIKNLKKSEYQIDSEKVDTISSKEFYKNLFGSNHPYSNYYEITDFDKITQKQLFNHFSRHYIANTCKIIVSGKLDDNFFMLTEKYFGKQKWYSDTPDRKSGNHEISSTDERYIHIEKQGALQSSIRIGNLTINKKHPDYPLLVILNTILGGYFGSRLMSNIREDKGYTYGINSIVYSLINTGVFVIITEVAKKHVKNTINEIFSEIKKLKTELVPEDELNSVKSYLIGEFIKFFDSPFASADAFKSIIDYNLDLNYYKNLFDKIRTVESKEILYIANKYLDESKMITVVAG